MATTTKTLTPTNQTITLPDMTERPNASILVDGIGKDADAINALSDQIARSTFVLSFEAGVSQLAGTCDKSAKVGVINIVMSLTSAISGSNKLFTIPSGSRPYGRYDFQIYNVSTNTWYKIRTSSIGDVISDGMEIPAGEYRVNMVYIIGA